MFGQVFFGWPGMVGLNKMEVLYGINQICLDVFGWFRLRYFYNFYIFLLTWREDVALLSNRVWKNSVFAFFLTQCGWRFILSCLLVLIVDSMTLLIPLIPMDRFNLIHIYICIIIYIICLTVEHIYIYKTLYYNAYIYIYHIYIYSMKSVWFLS